MKVGYIVDGKYELVRLIGKGGMGTVWEGRHVQIGRKSALKFLHPEVSGNAEIVSRFLREAQAAAAIGSDHIVDIYDVGQLPNGAPYLVMEHLDGKDLATVLKREGRQEQSRAVELILQLCEALEPAHEGGIVHRDLKPANLVVVQHEKLGPWLKVLDFGIAKVQAELSGQSKALTKTGMTMGTPFYMAPEQFQRAKDVDHRADIYSAGVILYQLLSGRLPYEADTYEELIIAVVTEEPTPLREALPRVDAGLESVVMRSMSRSVATRYGSMGELATVLQPFVQEAKAGPRSRRAIPATRHVEPSQRAAKADREIERVEIEVPRLPPTRVSEEVAPTPTAWESSGKRSRTWLWAGLGGGAVVVGLALVVGFSLRSPVDSGSAGNEANPVVDISPATEPQFQLVACRFTTNVPGARLIVGGVDYREAGSAGWSIELAVGQHSVELRHNNEVIAQQLLTVAEGQRPGQVYHIEASLVLPGATPETVNVNNGSRTGHPNNGSPTRATQPVVPDVAGQERPNVAPNPAPRPRPRPRPRSRPQPRPLPRPIGVEPNPYN